MKTQTQIDKFKKIIWEFYEKNKRPMPWRETTDPYKIVVSEIMLQQTQVNRVKEKYEQFLSLFPTFESLAKAQTKDVLTAWSGMGYNRRALYLQKIAQIVFEKYHGMLPHVPAELDELPGIGFATASSIAAFAFNYPSVFIETNIRRVFIHFFFQDHSEIDDEDIMPLVEKTLDVKNPREWYYALMDYGTYLAKIVENPNKKSRHYTIQSAFEGSDRQMRGYILKHLVKNGTASVEDLLSGMPDHERLKRSLLALEKEGFIMEKNGQYSIQYSPMTLAEKKKKVTDILNILKKLFPNAKTILNYSTTWEFLVAVMLSAQTTDKMVNKVTENLFKKYSTLKDYAAASIEQFEQDIHSVNYHHTKAIHIIEAAQMILKKYHGEVPHTMEELIELPGVGRKTANVILGNAFNAPVGIAVDTHVHRLSRLLCLTHADDPKKIEQDLMKIVPREDWTAFTHLMIEYGRTYCPARPHNHAHCPLASFYVHKGNT